EPDACRRHVALRAPDIGEGFREDRLLVHRDVEEVWPRSSVTSIPGVDDCEQEVEVNARVRGQPGQGQGRGTGGVPPGLVPEELPVEEVRDAVEGPGIGEVEVFAAEAHLADWRHVARGGDGDRARAEV